MRSISKEDVEKVLDEIDRDGVPARRRSTGWCLVAVSRDRHYPPKYALYQTYRLMEKMKKTGEPMPGWHGGKPVNTQFEKLDGYLIKKCDCRNHDLKIRD